MYDTQIVRPTKIYPNWDFRFENKPSGNPGTQWPFSWQAVVRGFLIVLALSLHEIFEGVALGLFSEQGPIQKNFTNSVYKRTLRAGLTMRKSH
jgi:hypothetical protein